MTKTLFTNYVAEIMKKKTFIKMYNLPHTKLQRKFKIIKNVTLTFYFIFYTLMYRFIFMVI